MGDKTVSVRVRFEGGDQVKAGLQEVGREGTRAIQNIGNVSQQTGAKLQNAGYQLSDFFVQVAGGTAPSRALAQQLPQLLQGFGLIGVAASVLVAALPSLWSLFSSGADDAEGLEDQINSLTQAMDAYKKAASAADAKPSDLFANFGGGAEQAKEALEIQRQIAAARAQNALGQATGSIADFLGDDAGRIEAYRSQIKQMRADIEAVRNNPPLAVDFDFSGAEADIAKLQDRLDRMNAEVVDSLSSSLNVTTEGAAQIVEALGVVAEASDAAPRDQAAAMAALRGTIIEAAAAGGTLTEESLRLLQSLTDAELAALGLAQVDMAGPIGAARREATALADELARAVAMTPGRRAREGDDGRGGQAEQRRSGAEYNSSVIMERLFPKGGKGGGGGGGGADPDIARAKALTEGVRTETEKYAVALEEVNRLKEKGLITDETYNRQLDKLGDKLGELGDLGKKAASAIRGAFDNLFDDPAAALKDLAKQLAMMALYSGLAKAFPGAFGGGGAVPLVPGFAAGGRHKGGLRIVGENGPELEATGPSMIYPNDMLRSMGRAGGGTIVQINNNTGQPAREERRQGPDGREIVRVIVGEELTRGGLDKPMRGRFGAQPNRMKR